MRCAWKDCTNEADPARPNSGPFDEFLCPYHDEVQKDADPDTTTTKEQPA